LMELFTSHYGRQI